MADYWATMEPTGLQIQGQWLRHEQSRPDDHAKELATKGVESNVKCSAMGDRPVGVRSLTPLNDIRLAALRAFHLQMTNETIDAIFELATWTRRSHVRIYAGDRLTVSRKPSPWRPRFL